MEIKFKTVQKQNQELSQYQLMSLEILAMDTIELNRFLQNEYLENPLLEYNGNRQSSWEQFYSRQKESAARDDYSGNQRDGEKWDKEIPEKEQDLFRIQFLDQLPREKFDEKEWRLMEYLTGCLDNSGFFTMPIQEAAMRAGYTEREVEVALDLLRELEPCGIFSRNLKQCLLKQLEKQGQKGTNLWRMVEEHLDDMAAGNIGKISRSLHIKTVEVRKYMQQITLLNPRPGMELQCGSENGYVIPDIIVRKENGQWEAELNDEWVEDYHLNDYYLKMINDCEDQELKEYFRGKLERVRLIMKSIEQRRNTILSITQAMIKRQSSYLDRIGSLQPMTMKELAEELGIHVSTVSRTVKDRYIQCSWGVCRMRDWFHGAVWKAAEGTQIGSAQIQEKIRTLVEQEDKHNPVSDQGLAQFLEDMGIPVSRRTVAKYRELMGIKASYARKI